MTEGTSLSTRRAQTQQRLLDAALEVFAERGILGASVEQICEAAGFTRGAFYSNFTSKDDLCVALLRLASQKMLAAASAAIDSIDLRSGELAVLIRQAIAAFMRLQPRDRSWLLFTVELPTYAARTPTVRDAYLTFLDESVPLVSNLVVPTLERAGYQLAGPPHEVLNVLRAVYDQSRLRALLLQGDWDAAQTERDLCAVLEAMCTKR